MAGNYDKMQEQARQLFRSYDPNKLRARLSLPEGLENIGPEAFPGCGFRRVRVPEHTTETGRDAFPREAI